MLLLLLLLLYKLQTNIYIPFMFYLFSCTDARLTVYASRSQTSNANEMLLEAMLCDLD